MADLYEKASAAVPACTITDEGAIRTPFGDDYDNEIAVIAKPDKHDYVTFDLSRAITVPLVARKPTDGYTPEYYYIPQNLKHLRKEVAGDLKPYVVVPYHNHTTGGHGLYIARHYEDSSQLRTNRYGRRLAKLFGESPEWHAARKIRIWADTDLGTYKIKYDMLAEPHVFAERDTRVTLQECLGTKRFILDASHPVYAEILAGEDYEG